MSYLIENLGTIIVSSILLIIVIFIIRSLIKKKKQGSTLTCNCGCANCTLNCKNRI